MIFDDVAGITSLADRERILDRMIEMFRSWGADFQMVAGLPLPGRPIEPLILRSNWPEGPQAVVWADPLLRQCLTSHRPFQWSSKTKGEEVRGSALFAALGHGEAASVCAFPIHTLSPYQACVLVGGFGLDFASDDLHGKLFVCERAFDHLAEHNLIDLHRPGELSVREKSVIELTAEGRTANDIAAVLNISQRTVHAHLHNASEKLAASNKTQTVVEAIRYSQIAF